MQNIKNINTRWQQIFTHDIEAAAFIIVSIMLAASVTSYALDVNKATEKSKQNSDTTSSINSIYRDPETVNLQDVNGDGINDIVLVHKSGQREVIITTNENQ